MTQRPQVKQRPETFEEWFVKSSYQEFIEREEVPVYEGSVLENLLDLPLADWKRRGGKAAYTRMGDQEGNNLQIVEIPPGGQLKPEHHMYDAIMFVMQGRGATAIWQEGEKPTHVEWHEGSLLAIPLNAWHQEFNGSGSEPCKIVFGTNMAQAINHYHNLDFVFGCPYVFSDRYSASNNKLAPEEGKKWNLRLFETGFIPDIRTFELDPWPERGLRTSIMRLSMADSSLGCHILEISEGTYVTAHRHYAGAHVIQVSGEGYEFLFMPGQEHDAEARRRFKLQPYGVVAPRGYEFHQHFNTTNKKFRQLAFRGMGPRFGTGMTYDPVGAAISADPFAWSFKIRHELEDPRIREEFYNELAKNGIDLRLEPIDQGSG